MTTAWARKESRWKASPPSTSAGAERIRRASSFIVRRSRRRAFTPAVSRSVRPPAVDDSIQRASRPTTARDSAVRANEREDSVPVAPPVVRPDSGKAKAAPGQPTPAKPAPGKPAPTKPAPAQPAPGKRPALVPAPDSGKAAFARLDSTLRTQVAADPGRKKPSRPPLFDRLVVRLTEKLEPGGKYAVEVRGVRNANGATGDSKAGFTVPERPRIPVDSTKLKGEKGDSTRPAVPGRDSVPPAAPSARPDSALVDPRRQPPPKR